MMPVSWKSLKYPIIRYLKSTMPSSVAPQTPFFGNSNEVVMKKIALFVFNGDPMCFIHVLLNALDMDQKGYDAKIVIEGAATKLIPELEMKSNPLHQLWEKAKSQGLVEGVCKACSNKMETISAVKNLGLPLLEDVLGHPGMARFRNAGFEIITF
jgi:hypothetical protein